MRSSSYAARNAPRHRRRREQHDPKGGGKEHHHSIGGKRRAAPGKRRAVLLSPPPLEWWRFPPSTHLCGGAFLPSPCESMSLVLVLTLAFCILPHVMPLSLPSIACSALVVASALHCALFTTRTYIDDGFLISICIVAPQMQRHGQHTV